MALDSKNNIKSVFIVNTALSPVTSGTITPGSTGVTGSVVIANMSNEVLVAGSGAGTGVLNYSKIKIIKDRGADLPLQQLVLDLNSISAYVGTAGVAAREQVSYVGFNGTTGSVGVLDNNFFTVKLEHVPNSFAYGKRPANYKYGTYQSGVAATEEQIANGLVASLVQNFRPNRTTDWRVFSEVVNASTPRTAPGSAGTLTFTKYSKSVKASATTATDGVTIGDYISSGTAVTAGVYKVTAIDAVTGNLTIATGYQGATVSGIVSTTLISIVEATAQAAAFGIKITGVKQKYDVNRWRQYDKVRFNVFIEGFTLAPTATAVSTVAALDGTAVYEQVANDEYISWGDEGQVFVDQVPPLFREQDAVVGTQYNPVVLGWLDRLPSLIGAGENKGQAILYMSGSATTAGQGATLVTVLNSWLTGKFANLPGTLV